jgi:hypothetical protein
MSFVKISLRILICLMPHNLLSHCAFPYSNGSPREEYHHTNATQISSDSGPNLPDFLPYVFLSATAIREREGPRQPACKLGLSCV